MDISNFSDSGSKHSGYTNHSKNEQKIVEITDQVEKIFILALMTFHLNNKIDTQTIKENQHRIKLFVGYTSFKTPDFFLSIAENAAD